MKTIIDETEASRRVKLWEQGYWEIPDNLDTRDFNFNWRPHKWDRPYIHQFGTQWQKTGGPRFVIPDNEGVKYQRHMIAKRLPTPELFQILIDHDIEFDWTWHPDDTEPAFIWTFGNQFKNSYEMPTVEYRVGSSSDRKHVDSIIAHLRAKSEYWKELLPIEEFGWDKTWCPELYEPPYIYVWGNQWNDATIEPTLEYRVPGATQYKYMTNFVPRLKPDMSLWNILIPIDMTSFDFSWRPNPKEPPYIYVWGNQWNEATTESTVEYRVPGATQYKYMNNQIPIVLSDFESNKENWNILIPIEEKSFDFSWRPNPKEPPYIYVWGNQWNEATTESTVEYRVPGATQYKYMTNFVPRLKPDMSLWNILIPIEEKSFDFSWRPNPKEPPYIYVWGNQWNDATIEPTLEYRVPGATQYKYMTETVDVVPDMSAWNILIPIDMTSFDFSWRPNPKEPPYIYVWGNQWNDATIEPTVEYWPKSVQEQQNFRSVERKYKFDETPQTLPDMSKWTTSDKNNLKNFDFSWRPNPHSPPQIYQWENGGPIYTVPTATEIVLMHTDVALLDELSALEVPRYYIDTTLEKLISDHPTETFWALNPDLNYERFDFSWRPSELNFTHINVFGNKLSKDTGTYYINAPAYLSWHRDINYIEDHEIEIVTDLDMFYILKGNPEGVTRFDELKNKYPRLQKTRYLNSWVDTISRCLRKSTSRYIWILSSEVDYNDFKFDYYPASWNKDKIHVFGNQWSHWGNTYLVNREKFDEDTKYIKIIEHVPTIYHVLGKKANISEYLFDLLYIDHGNKSSTLDYLKSVVDPERLHIIKFNTDYFTTLDDWFKKIPDYMITHEQLTWVCSSVCDYSNHDFTWMPDPFLKQKFHIFASEYNQKKQKTGDTFLVDMKEYRYQHTGINSIEDYPHGINYVSYLPVPRMIDFS
jgi:hypothetical protein